MSTPINYGGPAFPVASERNANGDFQWGYNGMTLRDYFAAKAIQGMIGTCTTEKAAANLVPACWVVADAMLAAREAKP